MPETSPQVTGATYNELVGRYLRHKRRLLPSETCLKAMREAANAHMVSDDHDNTEALVKQLTVLITAEDDDEHEWRFRCAHFNASRVLGLYRFYTRAFGAQAPNLTDLQDGLIHAEESAEERRLETLDKEGHDEVVGVIGHARSKPPGRPGAAPEKTAAILAVLKLMHSTLWSADQSEANRREKATIWADALAHVPPSLLSDPSVEARELERRLHKFLLSPEVNETDLKRLIGDLKGLSPRQVGRHLALVDAELQVEKEPEPPA